MKTLIILHGWQSSKEKWQQVKSEVEKEGIKVIVPDLPGFKPETVLKEPWDLDDYVEWLSTFLQRSEKTYPELVEGFFLLGHSFGGRVAVKFAVKYPQKLKGLILVAAAGIKKEKSKILNLTFLVVAKFVKSLLNFLHLKKLEFLLKKVFYCYILRRTDYFRAKGALRETFKKIIEEDLKSCLFQIKVPTLILWGKKDKVTPISDAELMKKEIKNSKLEILEKVGHTPHLEVPEKLAEVITKFLKR